MTQHAALLPRYVELRKVSTRLSGRIVESLPRDVLDEGARKLGLLKNKTLILDSQHEMTVFMDYCIHDVRRQGMNAVQRFLETSPPPPDSDEWILLQALRHARYSLFAVDSFELGVGTQVRDLLRDESLFITDVGFSQTAPIGTVVAARIYAPEMISMSTGAALPVGVMPLEAQLQFRDAVKSTLKVTDCRNLSTEAASELAAEVIRTGLSHGAGRWIEACDPGEGRPPRARSTEYREPGLVSHTRLTPESLPQARQLGRNDPCPCGSGKKFKRCCGLTR